MGKSEVSGWGSFLLVPSFHSLSAAFICIIEWLIRSKTHGLGGQICVAPGFTSIFWWNRRLPRRESL